MRLSEAMRLGAMNKPQGFGTTFGERTCALGAALEAVGVTDKANCWSPIYTIFPIARLDVDHPLLGYTAVVGHVCWILNDCHKWTREAIADWVESIEIAQVIEPGTNHVAACPQDEPQMQSVRA